MHGYKYRELKFRPHGSGKDKQSVTFCKLHDMIIIKFQASYENGLGIANSIWASEIVYIEYMEPESNNSEETYVKKNKLNREVSILYTKRKFSSW